MALHALVCVGETYPDFMDALMPWLATVQIAA